MRRERGLTVVGLRRGGSCSAQDLLEEKLQAGRHAAADRLLERTSGGCRRGGDLVVLNMPAELDECCPAGERGAAAVLAVVVGLMVSGVVANVQAALIGCLLMGLLGCVDMNSALSLDQLEEPDLDCRHAAVLDRAATDRRG